MYTLLYTNTIINLDRFFDDLKTGKLEKEVLFTYCVDLWTSIIRNNIKNFKQTRKKNVNVYLKELINLRDSATIDERKSKFKKIAIEIAGLNYERFARKKKQAGAIGPEQGG